MAPTLSPDGTVIDDGSQPFAGPPPFVGPRQPPNVADLSALSGTRMGPPIPTALPVNVPPPPAPSPSAAPAQAPDVVPRFLFDYARRSGALTRAPAISAASPEEQAQVRAPGYLEASNDPNTGMPSIANPGLTKLGKVLTLLRGAGMGFMAGAGQPNISRGFLAGNQFFNQEAQQNQEIQQRAQAMEQARQNQYVQMHGVHQYIYTRDPKTGDFMQQGVDVMGNPVTKQMPYAPKNPNRTPISIIDPADAAGAATGIPTMPLKTAWEDKFLGGIFDDNGERIPNAQKFESAIYNKATPAAGSAADVALAQAGKKPAANSRVYNGKTYSTPQDAQAAWGNAMQMAKIPGEPITAEMAEEFGLPTQFIGYKMKPTDVAALRRSQVFENVPVQTGEGEVIVNRRTATATLVKDANGKPTTPTAWAGLREVPDPNNAGLTKVLPGYSTIGMQGMGSAGFTVPRTIAEREVPTKGGDMRMAFGTMIDHANLLRQAAAALHTYGPDSQQVRGLENRFQNEFGSSGPITAEAIADAYKGEVSSVINKGHITDKGNEKVAHTLDPTHQNYDTIDSVLRAYQSLAQSKMNQLDLQEQRAAQRVRPQAAPQGGGGGATPPAGAQFFNGQPYTQQSDGSWKRWKP